MIQAPDVMFPHLRHKPLLLASAAPHHVTFFPGKKPANHASEKFLLNQLTSTSSLLPSLSALCSMPYCFVHLTSGLIQCQLQPCCHDLTDPHAFTIGNMYQDLFVFSRYPLLRMTHTNGPGKISLANFHTLIPIPASKMTDLMSQPKYLVYRKWYSSQKCIWSLMFSLPFLLCVPSK